MSVVFQLINCMLKNKTKIPKEKKQICHRNLCSFFNQKRRKRSKKKSCIFLPTVLLYVSYVLAIEPVHNDYVQQYAMESSHESTVLSL